MDELDLECVEKLSIGALSLATGGPTHGRPGPHCGELLPIGLGRVLAAAIRVADEPAAGRCRWAAIINAATLSSARM